MHSFFVENSALSSGDAKHAFRVLRLRPGDEITAISGAGRFRARLLSIDEKTASVETLEKLPDNEPSVRLTVYQGLPKSEKLELLAQKLTELGASRLVPVKILRSVAKIEGNRRSERLQKISREAVKQCGRSKEMEITGVMTWKQALDDMKNRDIVIIPWEEARGTRIKDVHAANPGALDIGVLIGPEGGIDASEAEAVGERVTLGPRILRAETAAIAASAIIMSAWGDI